MFLDRFFKRRRVQPRLPNLLCLGVEKCGTTFLNAAFADSADVLTPRKKELFYFNNYYNKGVDWYLSWYDFESKPGARYVADITPSYFRLAKDLGRISELLPGARVIMVLRHPVYRAFSHYVHRIRHKAPRLEAYGHSFADVLDRKDRYRLLCPKYGWHLRQILKFFPREDILLLTYEQDILDPLSAQHKLADFLDLADLDFGPMLGRRVNEGSMPRFYYGADSEPPLTLEGREYRVPRGELLLAHAKGTERWPDIDPSRARANIEASRNWTAALSPEQVARIYEEHFATDLEILRGDFGLDVDQWRRMKKPVHYEAALPDPELLHAIVT